MNRQVVYRFGGFLILSGVIWIVVVIYLIDSLYYDNIDLILGCIFLILVSVLFCVGNFFSFQAMSDSLQSSIEHLNNRYEKEINKYSNAMLEMQTKLRVNEMKFDLVNEKLEVKESTNGQLP